MVSARNQEHNSWYQMHNSWYQNKANIVNAGTKSVIIKEDNEMAKDLLSDSKIKAAKPKEKDYTLSDGEGLQLRVSVQGVVVN